jgi:cytochrome c556
MMTSKSAWLVGGALLWSAAAATVTLAADEPANLIKYRQATMGAIGGHMGALSGMAKGEVSFMDEAVGHAHAISEMSKNLARLFPEGSNKDAGKTAALPAIWEQPAQFQQAIEALQAESAKLVEVAQSGDQAAFATQLGALGKNGCTNCHNTFREKN